MATIDPGLAALAGLFLALPGGICLALAVAAGRDLRAMRETPTRRAADLDEIAPGTQVELRGLLRCDAPLRGEFSGRPCAWYRATVIHEVRDPDASPGRIGGREDRTAADTRRAVPCRVEDESGAVALDLEGAEVDGVKTVDVREERSAFSFSVAGFGLFGAEGRVGIGSDVVAVRHEESILEIDAPLTVLAVLREDGGLGRPAPGGRGRFLVSRRGEAELARAKTIQHRVLAAVSTVALPAGLGSLGLALVGWLAQ